MKLILINEFKEYTDDLANQHQTGASVSPDEFNRYCPVCVHDVVRRYYGLPELYKYGYTVPPVAFEVTQLLRDYISAYLLKESIQPVTSGLMLIPDDFLHFSSAAYGYWVNGRQVIRPNNCDECCTCKGDCHCGAGHAIKETLHAGPLKTVAPPEWKTKSITIVTDSQWNKLVDHPIKKPTIEYPIAKYVEKNMRVMPASIAAIAFNYLRYPKRPIWNYDDTTTPGFPVFVPLGSQDIELPEILMKEVGLSILDCVGFQVQDAMKMEYAARMKATGQ